jgi:hypothetical protein
MQRARRVFLVRDVVDQRAFGQRKFGIVLREHPPNCCTARRAQVDFSHVGAGRSLGGMDEEEMRPEADNSDKD